MPVLSTLSRRILFAALVLTTLSLHLFAGAQAKRERAAHSAFHVHDDVYLASPPVLQTMALGRTHFAADVLWIRGLSYFAAQFLGHRQYRWLDPLIDTIISLDERYRTVYYWAAVVLMYGSTIDNESVKASNRILKKGLELFPDDWEFHFILGCNYTFELRTEDENLRQHWKQLGADHIQSAANLPGAPDWLVFTAAGLHRKSGRLELAIRHLEEAYMRAQDKELRKQLYTTLAKLKNNQTASKLREEGASFRAAWESSFPYMNPDLFLFVGEKRPPRLPPHWTPGPS